MEKIELYQKNPNYLTISIQSLDNNILNLSLTYFDLKSKTLNNIYLERLDYPLETLDELKMGIFTNQLLSNTEKHHVVHNNEPNNYNKIYIKNHDCCIVQCITQTIEEIYKNTKEKVILVLDSNSEIKLLYDLVFPKVIENNQEVYCLPLSLEFQPLEMISFIKGIELITNDGEILENYLRLTKDLQDGNSQISLMIFNYLHIILNII